MTAARYEMVTLLADADPARYMAAAKCPHCSTYVRPLDGGYISWSLADLRKYFGNPDLSYRCGRCRRALRSPNFPTG